MSIEEIKAQNAEIQRYEAYFATVEMLELQVSGLKEMIANIKNDPNYNIFDTEKRVPLDKSETKLDAILAIING